MEIATWRMKEEMILKDPSLYEGMLVIRVFKRNVSPRSALLSLLSSECQYLTLEVVAVTVSSSPPHPTLTLLSQCSYTSAALESHGRFVNMQIAGPHPQSF